MWKVQEIYRAFGVSSANGFQDGNLKWMTPEFLHATWNFCSFSLTVTANIGTFVRKLASNKTGTCILRLLLLDYQCCHLRTLQSAVVWVLSSFFAKAGQNGSCVWAQRTVLPHAWQQPPNYIHRQPISTTTWELSTHMLYISMLSGEQMKWVTPEWNCWLLLYYQLWSRITYFVSLMIM